MGAYCKQIILLKEGTYDMLGPINGFILEYILGIEEKISMSFYFCVLDIAAGANGGILLRDVTYDMIGLIDGITHKYTLGIPLCAHETLELFKKIELMMKYFSNSENLVYAWYFRWYHAGIKICHWIL